MSDEETVFIPPDAATVARRALALSALTCRGFIENGPVDPDPESVRDRVLKWVTRFDLRKSLGPFECATIDSPLGTLTEQHMRQATWACEGLAVLAWALNRFELPKHDEQVNPYDVTDALFFLGDDADEIITTARLRGPLELQAYREVMYAIHCRLRDFLRNRKTCDFTTWIEDKWLAALHIDPARIIAEGDLGLGGKPVTALETDQIRAFESAISEHHRASIWLVGEDLNHWEVNADT